MAPNILDQVPITLAELKVEIVEIKKRGEEASVRVNKVEEYLNSVPMQSVEKTHQLIEELRKLEIPRMRDEYLVKIADIRPASIDDLKLIMQGFVISLSADNTKKIVDKVSAYL